MDANYHNKWRSQLNRGMLEFLILLLLKKNRYGYELLQLLRANVATTQDIADGPIYAILSRLKKENLVTIGETVVNGRKRRYYLLSNMGQQALQAMRKDWEGIQIAVNEFDALNK